MFRIHKAGWIIIRNLLLGLIVLNLPLLYLFHLNAVSIIVLIASTLLLIFVLRFFRHPNRVVISEKDILVAPADGKVVVVEEIVDDEMIGGPCIQVSIFMSVWNVHINWIPFNGVIKYFKHHHGQFLVALEPKSSTLNERTSLMIETESGVKIGLKQIAGYVARRIETYITKNETEVKRGQELGFIKFGSRVDILLPVGTEVLVKPGDKAIGCITPIAKMK
ncbi:MAG: phosphatidylserine decarboxylase family protein [Salinivirgaceae bacterium]|nr:phosphatidylserine decarboxylase family protein [Salinivirgaceae bacterium]MDD4747699.1 phosphatidylserine decarboxylase family protein [Salinivirgaceae bacterium]MDY0279258.1 phosphatidylserine decarboxylase family protein [Salinivirgaceae bacterium]